jgi:phage terminase Nu1 subunit (DNA packaging protein)
LATNAQPIGVIARLLDLSERRIQQLSREGVIPKAERGQYDLVAAVRGYVAYLRDLAVRAQAGAPDFGVERARLIKAKADLAEMEAEGRRGELLPAEAVETAWTAVLARLRARLLVLPDRLAPLCHEETTIAGVRDQIRKAVREALDEPAATPVVATAEPDGAAAPDDGGAAVALDPEAAAGALDQ